MAHLLALQDVTRAICALGIKAQPRKLIVAEALKAVLDEGRRGNPPKGLGYSAGIDRSTYKMAQLLHGANQKVRLL